jgi:hypothetical protein
MMTESKKQSIVCTLETQSTIQGVSTELAIQAGQNTKAAVVPSVYDQFHKLFSDTESLQFPPTRPWDHPLPLISDLLTDLCRAFIFTKLDVCDGYNNIHIKDGDEHKAAFKTKYGLWELLVMFFSLKNLPAMFQAMMNYEYKDTITYWDTKGTAVHIYMDNIAIATSTNLKDHIQAGTAVFEVAKRLNYISNLKSAPSMPHPWITWGYSLKRG